MFSWDAAKALKNYEKHGVSFEEASTAFDDPHALEVEDLQHVDPSERRWKRVAYSFRGRLLLLIVYTLRRLKNGEETIRVIRDRQATRGERKIYAGR
jgi:uncharacterized DUF497 family protein